MSFRVLRFTGAALLANLALSYQANPEHEPPKEDQLSTPYRVEVLAKDLRVPWAIVFLPDRRIFFTERTGEVRVLHGNQLLPEPALTLDVAQGNKMGLLGLAADPHFSRNHFLYLAYNYRLEPFDPAHPAYRLRLVRYREESDKLLEAKTLVEDIPAWSNHTGCRLRFASDGTLFMSTGDANEPPMAQRLDQWNGKILHLKPDGSPARGNPFTGEGGTRPEIWSYGHRNPQGFDFQPGSGRMLETEHGPLGGDEINWILPGHNYGWPVIDHRRTQEGMETPLLEFSPSIGPGSASFYRGRSFPELHGNFLVACLRGEGMLRVDLEETRVRKVTWLFHHTFGRIRDIAESPEGYLYLSTSQQDPNEGHPRPGEDDDLLLRIVPATVPASGLPVFQRSIPFAEVSQAAVPAGGAIAIIGRHCAACHGPELKSGMPTEVTAGGWIAKQDDRALRSLIRNGIPPKGMPGAPDLSNSDLELLIAYLRSLPTQRLQ